MSCATPSHLEARAASGTDLKAPILRTLTAQGSIAPTAEGREGVPAAPLSAGSAADALTHALAGAGVRARVDAGRVSGADHIDDGPRRDHRDEAV